jgi:hypothetical protein
MREATMRHATISIEKHYPDHTEIREEVYLDELKYVITRTEKRMLSSESGLLADAINCLDVFKRGETTDLTIHVRRKKGEILITKSWKVKKEEV